MHETEDPRARQRARSTACAFCGRKWQPGIVRRSDEHVWGALRRDLREIPASRMTHVTGFATSPSGQAFVEIPAVTTTNKASAFHVITREVCKDCNTGWMNRLEQRSKPLMLGLVDAACNDTSAEWS